MRTGRVGVDIAIGHHFGRLGLFADDNTHHASAMAYAAVDALGSGDWDARMWSAAATASAIMSSRTERDARRAIENPSYEQRDGDAEPHDVARRCAAVRKHLVQSVKHGALGLLESVDPGHFTGVAVDQQAAVRGIPGSPRTAAMARTTIGRIGRASTGRSGTASGSTTTTCRPGHQ